MFVYVDKNVYVKRHENCTYVFVNVNVYVHVLAYVYVSVFVHRSFVRSCVP